MTKYLSIFLVFGSVCVLFFALQTRPGAPQSNGDFSDRDLADLATNDKMEDVLRIPHCGQLQPNIRLSQIKSKIFSMASNTEAKLKAQITEHSGKGLLLIFWATWCKPCLAELPILEEVYQQNKEQVEFLGISQDLNTPTNQTVIHEIISNNKISFRQYLEDSNGNLSSEIFSTKENIDLPAFALFNKEGALSKIFCGSILVQTNRIKLDTGLAELSNNAGKL